MKIFVSISRKFVQKEIILKKQKKDNKLKNSFTKFHLRKKEKNNLRKSLIFFLTYCVNHMASFLYQVWRLFQHCWHKKEKKRKQPNRSQASQPNFDYKKKEKKRSIQSSKTILKFVEEKRLNLRQNLKTTEERQKNVGG